VLVSYERMKKSRIILAAVVALVCVIAIYLVRLFTAQGSDAKVLERQIRVGLPVGKSLSDVEAFLTDKGIEFSFDEPSKSVHAISRNVKGSTWLASKSLSLRFYFDSGLTLKSVESKVLYTGP
jgi:hypothetical protein